MNSFVRQSRVALRAMLVFTVLLGLAYPAVVWGVGAVAARGQASGSLVEVDGKVVGSSLVGQKWEGEQWFSSRPSASDNAGDVSGGTNLGPAEDDLDAAVAERAAAAGLDPASAPADALTASGSGLDPHISPEYAQAQVERVARARGIPAGEVQRLVGEATQGRTLGFLGEPRVNVLSLNVAVAALDRTDG